MSKLVGRAIHPAKGSTEDIYEGFSWPCVFLGPVCFLLHSLEGWAAMSGRSAPTGATTTSA